MESLRIVELRSAPEFIDPAADWLLGEWYSHRGDTLAQVRNQLRVDHHADALATTFVSHCEQELVGTFTLEESTEPRSGQPLFSLSNLFVASAWRRQGIGRQLCEAAVEAARKLRIPRFTLFTGSHAPYYASLGWKYVDIVTMDSRGREEPVFVMRRDVGVLAPFSDQGFARSSPPFGPNHARASERFAAASALRSPLSL